MARAGRRRRGCSPSRRADSCASLRSAVRGIVPSPGASASKIGSRWSTADFVAADHHAIAPIKAPYAARHADIEIPDAHFCKRFGATDVVLVAAVPAVDDDVAVLRNIGERADHVLGGLAGREHHPEGRGSVELAPHDGEPGGADRSLPDEIVHGLGRAIIDHGVMPLPDQPPRNVAPHAAEADDADLHSLLPKMRSKERSSRLLILNAEMLMI